MSDSAIVCTHCNTVLKSNKVVPAGVELLCPRCKKTFKVPAPVPAHTAAAGNDASSPSTFHGHRSDDRDETSAGSAARLVIVLAAIALFLGVGAGLIVWCFSGDANQGPKAGPATDPADVPVKAARRESTPPLSREEAELLDTMKRKGIAFLKKTQGADGAWPNDLWSLHLAAMGGLTLLECGVPTTDPAVQKAAALVRQKKAFPNEYMTYGVSLHLLFLDKLNDPQDRELIKNLSMRLMTGQSLNGAWSYEVPPLSADEEKQLHKVLHDAGQTPWKKFVAGNPPSFKELSPRLRQLSIFNEVDRPIADFYKLGGDNSNTQFALLALWAARRHKLPVDLPLQLIVKRFRASQEEEGRWIYGAQKPGEEWPAMTCAGLLALAVGYGLETPLRGQSEDPLADPAILKALAYLGNKIGTTHRDPKSKPAPVPYYFLWSVERVGVLYGLPTIGDKDWFRWGLRTLQAHQKDDGSWQSVPGEDGSLISDTCFALLFLQQVNLTQDLTDKLQALQEFQASATEGAKK